MGYSEGFSCERVGSLRWRWRAVGDSGTRQIEKSSSGKGFGRRVLMK